MFYDYSMNFDELIEKRQSVRLYNKEKLVEKEKIEACLYAAHLAPSACNSQPWHFTVVQGEKADKLEKYTHGLGMNKFTTSVPVFVVVSEAAYNVTAGIGSKIKHHDFRSCDIGAAVSYFTLQAQDLGLGTCILGWFDEKPIKKLCGIKGRIQLVIAVGYPAENYPLRKKIRKNLSEIVDWQ